MSIFVEDKTRKQIHNVQVSLAQPKSMEGSVPCSRKTMHAFVGKNKHPYRTASQDLSVISARYQPRFAFELQIVHSQTRMMNYRWTMLLRQSDLLPIHIFSSVQFTQISWGTRSGKWTGFYSCRLNQWAASGLADQTLNTTEVDTPAERELTSRAMSASPDLPTSPNADLKDGDPHNDSPLCHTGADAHLSEIPEGCSAAIPRIEVESEARNNTRWIIFVIHPIGHGHIFVVEIYCVQPSLVAHSISLQFVAISMCMAP